MERAKRTGSLRRGLGTIVKAILRKKASGAGGKGPKHASVKSSPARVAQAVASSKENAVRGRASSGEKHKAVVPSGAARAGKKALGHSAAIASSTATPAAGPKYFFHSDVPESYDETYMRAMPKDPEWIFVYWEISEATRRRLIRKMGRAEYEAAAKVLRMIDVSEVEYDCSGSARYVDMEIDRYAASWYVRVQEYGKSYVFECGFRTAGGRFHCAVRSNRVTVPRFGPSPTVDPDWNGASSRELIMASWSGNGKAPGASEGRFDVAGEETVAESIFNLAGPSGSGFLGVSSGRMR